MKNTKTNRSKPAKTSSFLGSIRPERRWSKELKKAKRTAEKEEN